MHETDFMKQLFGTAIDDGLDGTKKSGEVLVVKGKDDRDAWKLGEVALGLASLVSNVFHSSIQGDLIGDVGVEAVLSVKLPTLLPRLIVGWETECATSLSRATPALISSLRLRVRPVPSLLVRRYLLQLPLRPTARPCRHHILHLLRQFVLKVRVLVLLQVSGGRNVFYDGCSKTSFDGSLGLLHSFEKSLRRRCPEVDSHATN